MARKYLLIYQYNNSRRLTLACSRTPTLATAWALEWIAFTLYLTYLPHYSQHALLRTEWNTLVMCCPWPQLLTNLARKLSLWPSRPPPGSWDFPTSSLPPSHSNIFNPLNTPQIIESSIVPTTCLILTPTLIQDCNLRLTFSLSLDGIQHLLLYISKQSQALGPC